MGWTTADRTALAAELTTGADIQEAAAASGRAVAADTSRPQHERDRAARSAAELDRQARQMRADADAIRRGVNPADLGHVRT